MYNTQYPPTYTINPSSGLLELTNATFDEKLNIVDPNLMSGKLIILFYRPKCPHCDIYHPKYEEASKRPNKDPYLQFAEVNTGKPDGQQLLNRIQQAQGSVEFEVRGVPTVLGYANGKFYSMYEPSDDSDPNAQFPYRSPEDTLIYGAGIGVEPVSYH